MDILITGGTGSFGTALAKELLRNPSVTKLILYARGEHRHERVAAELNDDRLRSFVGDIRDQKRLTMALRGVDRVYHAAAMKVVPLCEYNPLEAIQTNTIGAANLIEAALSCEVKDVVALSTDKAVAPVNLYGATKLASERLFVAANNLSGGHRTRFACVRYGNVSGSAGSVIPVWRQAVKEGRLLPVTSPLMTRFWITMAEAARFVNDSMEIMQGGEVFVPKLPSFSIQKLAEAFERVHGVKSHMVGKRPGEKVHETLISMDEQNVLERTNDYLIAPSIQFFHKAKYPGKPVSPLKYDSKNNDDWLTVEDLTAYLEATE